MRPPGRRRLVETEVIGLDGGGEGRAVEFEKGERTTERPMARAAAIGAKAGPDDMARGEGGHPVDEERLMGRGREHALRSERGAAQDDAVALAAQVGGSVEEGPGRDVVGPGWLTRAGEPTDGLGRASGAREEPRPFGIDAPTRSRRRRVPRCPPGGAGHEASTLRPLEHFHALDRPRLWNVAGRGWPDVPCPRSCPMTGWGGHTGEPPALAASMARWRLDHPTPNLLP